MIKSFKLLIIFLLVFALALTAAYFNRNTLLPAYASLFRIDNPSKGADAIIILGGGASTRPAKAIELFRQGFAKTVCITQIRNPAPKYNEILKGETDLILEILAQEKIIALQIPSNKGGATSTFDEARDLARYIKAHKGFDHLIIVTDSFHTSRAHYAFSKIFAQQGVMAKIEMAAAPNQIFNESNWWKTEKGLTNYILEPLKYLIYLANNKNVTFVKEN